jgi:hypothetical protein
MGTVLKYETVLDSDYKRRLMEVKDPKNTKI